MADVFISYANKDRDRVGPLVEALEKQGLSVWWDRHIHTGTRFDEVIAAEIQKASCVLVVWSRLSVASRWVRDEANEGLERGILVPLIIDEIRPPLGFRSAQTANLVDWPQRQRWTELNAVIEGVQHLLGSEYPKEPSVAAPIDHSIAVLKFADMSSDGNQAAICAGMAEEILNKLAQFRDLKVVARTSSFQFDSNETTAHEIGARLGVSNILDGSIRMSGSQIRITVQLIRCEGEVSRWSETYTRNLGDIFALYDEIADRVGRELQVIIGDEHPLQVATASTASPEAHMALMQAQFAYMQTGSPHRVLPMVDSLLVREPKYATAHWFKANLHYYQADSGKVLPLPKYKLAKESASRALSLDPECGPARQLLASITAFLELDFRKAASLYEEAAKLTGFHFGGWLYLCAGLYDESLGMCLEHEEHDPASPIAKMYVGRVLDKLGRVDEATLKFEQALELAPQNRRVYWDTIVHYIDWASDLERAQQIIDSSSFRSVLTSALLAHASGNTDPLRSLVDRSADQKDREGPGRISVVLDDWYYRLGDFDAYIPEFKSRVEHQVLLPWVPVFLRDHPDYWARFREWVLSEPTKTRERLEMLDEHRALVDRVTKRMLI